MKFLVVGSFQMKNEEESGLDVEEYSLHVCKPGQWLRESINLDFNDNTLRTKMSFALILTVSPRLWSWTCKYPFFYKKNLFTRQSLRVLMLYILPTFISILTLWILWWAFPKPRLPSSPALKNHKREADLRNLFSKQKKTENRLKPPLCNPPLPWKRLFRNNNLPPNICFQIRPSGWLLAGSVEEPQLKK